MMIAYYSKAIIQFSLLIIRNSNSGHNKKNKQFDFQMSRKESKRCKYVLTRLINLLQEKSSLPKHTQFILLLLELFIFTTIVSFSFNLTQITSIARSTRHSHLFVLSLNLALLFTRLFFKFTLIRPTLVLCIVWSPLREDKLILSLMCFSLISFNLLIDALSHCDFSFSSFNPYTETLNINKFFHNYGCFTVAFILLHRSQIFAQSLKQWLPDLISTAIFILLFILKIKSECKNEQIKNLLLRVYFINLLTFPILLLVKINNININSLLLNIAIFFLSQILFIVLEKKILNKTSSRDLEVKEGNSVGFIFQILVASYHSSELKDVYVNVLNHLMALSLGVEQSEHNSAKHPCNQSKLKNSRLNLLRGSPLNVARKEGKKFNDLDESHREQSTVASSVMMQLFEGSKQGERKKNFYLCLLEMEFLLKVERKVIRVKRELVKMQEGKLSVLKYVCVRKLESELNEMIEGEKLNHLDREFKWFEEHEKFIHLIYKSSLQYYRMWIKLTERNLQLENIYNHAKKLHQFSQACEHQFEDGNLSRNQSACAKYSRYIYEVERNYDRANQILRNLEIFIEAIIPINTDSLTFITLSLDPDAFLCIRQAGFNFQKLFGYEKYEVDNLSLFLLLSPTYRDKVVEIMQEEIFQLGANNFLWYRKKILLRHALGYYLPALICCQIVRTPTNEFILKGYLDVQNKAEYGYENFFIIDEEGNIEEIGCSLESQIEFNRDDSHYTAYFTEDYSNEEEMHKYLFDRDNHKYEIFEKFHVGGDKFYELCVEFNSISDNTEKGFLKTVHYCLFDEPTEDKEGLTHFFHQSNQLQKQIRQNTTYCLYWVVFALILSLLALHIYLTSQISIKVTTNAHIEQQFWDIFTHYEHLNNLEYQYEIFVLNRLANGFEIPGLPVSHRFQDLYQIMQNMEKINVYAVKKYRVGQKKTIEQLLSIVISNIFSLAYYEHNAVILSVMVDKNREIFEVVYSGANDEYLLGLQKKIEERIMKTDYAEMLMVCIVPVGLGLIFVLMMGINYRMKEIQKKTLDVLSNLRNNLEFKANITSFIQFLTGHEPELLRLETKEQKKKNVRSSIISQDIHHSIMTSQHSSRDLISNHHSMHSRPRRSKQKEESKQYTPEPESKMALQKSKGYFPKFDRGNLLGWGVLITLFLAIAFTEIIQKVSNSNIHFESSLLNLISLLHNHEKFSESFLMHLENIQLNDPKIQRIVTKGLLEYNQLIKTEIYFSEEKLKDFNNFKNIMTKLENQPICDYIQCDEEFNKFSSLTYPALIHKMKLYIESNESKRDLLSGDFSLKSFIYSFNVISKVLVLPYTQYFSDFKNFQQNQNQIKYALKAISFILAFTVLGFLLQTYLVKQVSSRQINQKLLNIVQKRHYNKTT